MAKSKSLQGEIARGIGGQIARKPWLLGAGALALILAVGAHDHTPAVHLSTTKQTGYPFPVGKHGKDKKDHADPTYTGPRATKIEFNAPATEYLVRAGRIAVDGESHPAWRLTGGPGLGEGPKLPQVGNVISFMVRGSAGLESCQAHVGPQALFTYTKCHTVPSGQ